MAEEVSHHIMESSTLLQPPVSQTDGWTNHERRDALTTGQFGNHNVSLEGRGRPILSRIGDIFHSPDGGSLSGRSVNKVKVFATSLALIIGLSLIGYGIAALTVTTFGLVPIAMGLLFIGIVAFLLYYNRTPPPQFR